MSDAGPDQPPPRGKPRREFPLSQPPARPANWWRSVPGQLAIVVIAFGLLFIFCQVAGIVDFLPH